MILLMMLWAVILGAEGTIGRARVAQGKGAIWVKRVMITSLIWASIISLNSIVSLWVWEQGIEEGNPLYNGYFQWTQIGGILEVFTYIIGIVLIRKEWGIEKVLSLWGIVILLYANDYISFYVALECQSLVLYILASRDSVSSGLKYFVIGSLSSAIILLGIAIIYSQTGVTDITMINNIILSSEIGYEEIIWGRRLIIVGILIKLGVPPFHLWNIDIMDSSKTDITAWFGTISKLSLLYILRIITPSYGEEYNLGFFIIISLLVGTFMGLIQNKIKRLLAYSGTIHLGFILLGLHGFTSAEGLQIETGYISWIFYIAQYFMALIVVLIIIQQVNAIYIQDLKINNFSTAILIINLLSLAGFPPLLGFVGKFIILKGVIGQAFLICLIAMIISVFSFFIYFNVIGLIQIDKTHYITSLSDAWLITTWTLLPLVLFFSYLAN